MRCSSSHCSTPICARPRAAPPSRATPIFCPPGGAVSFCATAEWLTNTPAPRQKLNQIRDDMMAPPLPGAFAGNIAMRAQDPMRRDRRFPGTHPPWRLLRPIPNSRPHGKWATGLHLRGGLVFYADRRKHLAAKEPRRTLFSASVRSLPLPLFSFRRACVHDERAERCRMRRTSADCRRGAGTLNVEASEQPTYALTFS